MIQLQFSRQADLISDIISYTTQGSFSHVDCVMPDGTLLGSRSDRVGGKPAGVQKRPYDYANFALKVVLKLEVTKEQENKFYEFLYQQIGKPYDHTAIWGFATGRNWREEDSWICSELQAAALEYADICSKLYTPVNKISPNLLVCVVSAIGGKRIEEV